MNSIISNYVNERKKQCLKKKITINMNDAGKSALLQESQEISESSHISTRHVHLPDNPNSSNKEEILINCLKTDISHPSLSK